VAAASGSSGKEDKHDSATAVRDHNCGSYKEAGRMAAAGGGGGGGGGGGVAPPSVEELFYGVDPRRILEDST